MMLIFYPKAGSPPLVSPRQVNAGNADCGDMPRVWVDILPVYGTAEVVYRTSTRQNGD